MIDDNAEKKSDAKKATTDVEKKTGHAKANTEKGKASHKK